MFTNYPDGPGIVDFVTSPADPILGVVVFAVVIFMGIRKLTRALRKRYGSKEWRDVESDNPDSS